MAFPNTEPDRGPPAATVKDLLRALAESRAADVTGLSAAARGWVAKELIGRGGAGRLLLAVAPGEDEADELARDLAFFLGGGPGPTPVLRVPADPVLPYDDLSPDRSLEMERLAALGRLHLNPSGVKCVVVSARALARRMVPRAVFERHTDLLGKGVTVDREALAAKLVSLGYARVPLVEDPGTFAVRGGIIDLWSPLDEKPVRL
ncbi:MAG TPA: transcription-repair coupling factor, partial [Anaeromyxobacteraceae bacterium]